MKNIVLSVLGVGVLLVGAYFWLNHYLYQEIPEETSPEHMTLSGTYVCLPLVDGSAEDGCTAGVRADDGAFYAIDLGLLSQGAPQLVSGDKIEASGIVTPIVNLSTDFWQKYPVVGIFSVTDSLNIVGKESVGESHASSSITQHAWVWVKTILQDGTEITPDTDAFVLSLLPDLTYTSTTDCNSLSGIYAIDGEVVSFASPIMTKMFCENSQESEYVTELSFVNSYAIEGDTMRLNLNRDYGIMEFVRK